MLLAPPGGREPGRWAACMGALLECNHRHDSTEPCKSLNQEPTGSPASYLPASERESRTALGHDPPPSHQLNTVCVCPVCGAFATAARPRVHREGHSREQLRLERPMASCPCSMGWNPALGSWGSPLQACAPVHQLFRVDIS